MERVKYSQNINLKIIFNILVKCFKWRKLLKILKKLIKILPKNKTILRLETKKCEN